jgi:hypothetical protein
MRNAACFAVACVYSGFSIDSSVQAQALTKAA